MSSTQRTLRQTELLHRLLLALETTRRSLVEGSPETRDAALSGGRSALGDLQESLDPAASPEASAHLGDLCGGCQHALGEAERGNVIPLAAVTAMLRSVLSVITRVRLAA